MDPETHQLTALVHPRVNRWQEHFRTVSGRIFGLTAIGRTTVYVLNMNDPERLRTRLELEPEIFP